MFLKHPSDAFQLIAQNSEDPMFRKDFYKLLLLSIFCLAGATLAFGQTAPISGRVVLKKADNTTVPVEGA
jgi:hypothetical protein